MSCSFVRAYDAKLGLRYASHPNVYSPAEDTYLLAELVLRHGGGKRFLELGSGTGILSAYLSIKLDMWGLAVDVNLWAAYCTKLTAEMNEARVHVIIGSGPGAISRRFQSDLVVFNPPYLPEDSNDCSDSLLDLATLGGARGYETALEWAEAVTVLLAPTGLILFVTSSLSPGPTQEEIEAVTSMHVVERREVAIGDYMESLIGWVLGP